MRRAARHPRHILAIDIGGSHVKLKLSNRGHIEQFRSGNSLTPRDLVRQAKVIARQWNYHRVTVGFPGVVVDGCIVCEPINLGHGWVGFDFARAFGCPIRLMNDAAMQALGSYAGGRMLFLGFGTGLGAVFISGSTIRAMELAHLPFTKRGLIQNYVGKDALRRIGRKRWSDHARRLITQLSRALKVDYTVIGGGNAQELDRLPRNVHLGHNDLALLGGVRAWRRATRSE